jgi:hypothetical protein
LAWVPAAAAARGVRGQSHQDRQEQVRFSLNPQYNSADDAGQPTCGIQFNFTPLVPAK